MLPLLEWFYWCVSRSEGFPGGSVVKNPPANAGEAGLILAAGRSLEVVTATHSNILAWKIPWTEIPRLQRVGHDLVTKQQPKKWSDLPRITQLLLLLLSHFSCVQLCGPTDSSPPGSSVPGILQARILQWIAMPSSRESSRPRDWTHVFYVSCIGRWVLYH